MRLGPLQLGVQVFGGHAQLEPVVLVQLAEVFLGDLGAFLDARSTSGNLAHQGLFQTLVGGTFNDTVFIVDVLAHLVQLHLLDLDGALVLFQTITGKDLHINDRTGNAGGYTQ